MFINHARPRIFFGLHGLQKGQGRQVDLTCHGQAHGAGQCERRSGIPGFDRRGGLRCCRILRTSKSLSFTLRTDFSVLSSQSLIPSEVDATAPMDLLMIANV